MRLFFFTLVLLGAACAQAQPARTCFIGAVAGQAFGQSQHLSSSAPVTDRFEFSGRTAGVSFGCNWPRAEWIAGPQSAWLFGLEADLSGADASAAARDLSTVSPTTTSETRFDRLATLRGRVGFEPRSRLLPYGTGGLGVAWAKAAISNDAGQRFEEAQKLVGAVVGGGGEYWVARLVSVRLEYLYFAFAKKAFFDPAPAGFADRQGGIDPELHVVRLGVNLHF
jgi:opacity protein-like surface antigen